MNASDMAQGVFFCAESYESKLAPVLSEWRNSCPGMGVLALVAEAERDHVVPLLQKLCRDMAVPLCGAVFPALIFDNGFQSTGCLLLRFDVMPFASIYLLSDDAPGGLPATLARISRDVSSRNERPYSSTLFMVFDAMVANISTLLDNLYLELADQVHYMGVNAGSEHFQPIPCLFDNNSVASHAVLAVLLTDFPGAVVEHCYRTPELLISATATDGNRIIAIDWRPAFEVYQETVAAEYGVHIDRDNFYQYAVHYPFGIIRANGDIVVRIPVALTDDNSLLCVGEVPANSVLTLMKASEIDSGMTVRVLADGLANRCGADSGGVVLSFYCAGRRMHLGREAAERELSALFDATGASRLVGALSLGEIGHSLQLGYPLFHNGAVVCSRWNCP